MNPLLASLVTGVPAAEAAVPRMEGASPLAPRPGTPIAKLNYSHQAMIDLIIAEPWISQNELAARFGYSPSWISTVLCSDLFQSMLSERRDALVDPELRLSIKTQFEGLLSRSMEVLRHKLDRPMDEIPDQLALQVAKTMSSSLGHGVKETKISITETHTHLSELGNNLVGLLRQRKSEAISGDFHVVQENWSDGAKQESGKSSG